MYILGHYRVFIGLHLQELVPAACAGRIASALFFGGQIVAVIFAEAQPWVGKKRESELELFEREKTTIFLIKKERYLRLSTLSVMKCVISLHLKLSRGFEPVIFGS
jgi:hypothetical protein